MNAQRRVDAIAKELLRVAEDWLDKKYNEGRPEAGEEVALAIVQSAIQVTLHIADQAAFAAVLRAECDSASPWPPEHEAWLQRLLAEAERAAHIGEN